MESQPQNPDFRNCPENLHPCDLNNFFISVFILLPFSMGAHIAIPLSVH